MAKQESGPLLSDFSTSESHHTEPRPDDLFHTDDIEDPVPTPPYRPVPSSSHLLLDAYQEHSPSPVYKSRSNLDLTYDMGDRSSDSETAIPDDKNVRPAEKPSVHYPEDIASTHVISPQPQTPEAGFSDLPRSATPSVAGTDDEYEEDYDWSGEEDLVDEEAKFEQAMGMKHKQQPWGFKRLVTLLFSSLIGSTFLSGIIITPAILVHFVWYNPHPTPQRLYIKDNVEAWLFWAAANVIISWYLALLVDIFPVLVRTIISLFWGHVSEAVKSRTEMYNSVKHTLKPLLYAASGWVSWVILFESIYQLYDSGDESKSRASYAPRMYEVIEFFFFFVLVISGQRMLLHAIAFGFHHTAFRERLDSLHEVLKATEQLRKYRPKRTHPPKASNRSGSGFTAFGFNPFAERDHTNFHSRSGTPANSPPGTPMLSGNEGDMEDPDATLVGNRKNKGKQRTSWLGNMAISVNTAEPEATVLTDEHNPTNSPHRYPPTASDSSSPVRTGASTPARRMHGTTSDEDAAARVQQVATHAAKALKTAIMHDARNIRGESDHQGGGLAWNVGSAHEAKRLARSIYTAFKDRRRNYLVPSDFHPAYPTHEEAEAAFRVFDQDNNGDISRAEIKTTLMKVYKERRFLSRSMRDVGQALQSLDRILLFFALVILFFISLSVFRVSVGTSLTSFYSIGVGASFIFKNTASNAFDAIMFLFVTHPFDTGDRCFIDEENLVVKKMGLFATIFQRADGTETYYFNSQLFTKFITNVRRSDKTAENLTMQVAWRTPLEKLDALEKCLNDWLATEENRWFQPNTAITLQKINFQRHLELTIGICHNGNWQMLFRDWGLRNARKTAFHAAVNYFCRQLGIVAHEAPIPVVWADQDTLEVLPSPLPGGEDEANAGGDWLPPARTQRDDRKQAVLGFQPPAQTRLPSVRARKSKHRKAMLATMGADG